MPGLQPAFGTRRIEEVRFHCPGRQDEAGTEPPAHPIRCIIASRNVRDGPAGTGGFNEPPSAARNSQGPPGRSMHPVPSPTVMGRAAAVPAAIGPPMPCPVWWPVTIAMAMLLPVTMLVPVTMAFPVAMTPSVMAGRITISPGWVIGVRPVIGNPPVMPSIDLPDDDPDGQCRKGAGKQSLGDVIGMPPVVGRGAPGCDQEARYQKRGDKAANHGRLSVHDDPPGP